MRAAASIIWLVLVIVGVSWAAWGSSIVSILATAGSDPIIRTANHTSPRLPDKAGATARRAATAGCGASRTLHARPESSSAPPAVGALGAILAAIVFLHGQVTPWFWVGSALILAGLVLTELGQAG